MNILRKGKLLFPTIGFLFALAGCNAGSTGGAYSKNVVYHCYQNYGGSSGLVAFSNEYGLVFDGEYVYNWSNVGGAGEKKENPQRYRVDNDGNVIWVDYLGNMQLIWGKITTGVFQTYPYSRQGSYPQVYVTEAYYNTWLKPSQSK